jgi:hypothetical protein
MTYEMSASMVIESDVNDHGFNRMFAIKHNERSVLIGEPSKRGKGNHSIRPNHDQTAQCMSRAWQTAFSTYRADAIPKNQVSVIDMH